MRDVIRPAREAAPRLTIGGTVIQESVTSVPLTRRYLWLIVLALLPVASPTIRLITGLLLLAPLVFVPLALGLAAGSSAYHMRRWRFVLRVHQRT